MDPTCILIVEDEFIVAHNLQRRLENLGYRVPALAASVDEAIAEAARTRPDLILMDVRLQGGGDGIVAAREIHRRFGTPIVYLTAYADDETLARCKDTVPFGFLPKPFGLRELRTTIEVALHKSQVERRARAAERWMEGVLSNVHEGVIAIDASGVIVAMNAIAERLTSVPRDHATWSALAEVLSVACGEADASRPRSLERDTLLDLRGDLVIHAADGRNTRVACTATPVDDERGTPLGTLLVLRPLL